MPISAKVEEEVEEGRGCGIMALFAHTDTERMLTVYRLEGR